MIKANIYKVLEFLRAFSFLFPVMKNLPSHWRNPDPASNRRFANLFYGTMAGGNDNGIFDKNLGNNFFQMDLYY